MKASIEDQLRMAGIIAVVTLENAAEYLSEPSVLALGGSWLAPTDAIRQGKWNEITGRARDARQWLGRVNALSRR